ncbi:hypothetical protein LEP1GSC070_3155 [Leptospira santarosai str. AIM]|nr:hypothetical protein LEP1GSC070_3155 [Leptospira santarosai str. AIM]
MAKYDSLANGGNLLTVHYGKNKSNYTDKNGGKMPTVMVI